VGDTCSACGYDEKCIQGFEKKIGRKEGIWKT